MLLAGLAVVVAMGWKNLSLAKTTPLPAEQAAYDAQSGMKISVNKQVCSEKVYGRYMKKVERALKRGWHPPHPEKAPFSGTVTRKTIIYFRILPDGKLDSIALHKSSGDAAYDDTAMAQATNIMSLTPLPVCHTDAFLPVEMTFDLQQQNHWLIGVKPQSKLNAKP